MKQSKPDFLDHSYLEHSTAETGYDLAEQANSSFNGVQKITAKVDAYHNASVLEGVTVDPEAIEKVEQEFTDRKLLHSGLVEAAGALIGRGSFGERYYQKEREAAETALSETASDTQAEVWTQLTPEQKNKAETVTTNMAEMFNRGEEDFTLLRTEEADGSNKFVVAYSAPNGLDLGDPSKAYHVERSYKSIVGEERDQEFMVKVGDDQVADTRKGMTAAAYRALVAQAKTRIGSEVLPDSLQLAEENDGSWIKTLLTGEEAVPFRAWLAHVHDTETEFNRQLGDWSVGHNVRFRPAVEIA